MVEGQEYACGAAEGAPEKEKEKRSSEGKKKVSKRFTTQKII